MKVRPFGRLLAFTPSPSHSDSEEAVPPAAAKAAIPEGGASAVAAGGSGAEAEADQHAERDGDIAANDGPNMSDIAAQAIASGWTESDIAAMETEQGDTAVAATDKCPRVPSVTPRAVRDVSLSEDISSEPGDQFIIGRHYRKISCHYRNDASTDSSNNGRTRLHHKRRRSTDTSSTRRTRQKCEHTPRRNSNSQEKRCASSNRKRQTRTEQARSENKCRGRGRDRRSRSKVSRPRGTGSGARQRRREGRCRGRGRDRSSRSKHQDATSARSRHRGTGAPAVAPAQGSRSRPGLSKQGVATPVDGAPTRTNVQLTANTATRRWRAPANRWTHSTRGRFDRLRGAAPAQSAAVAAQAPVPNVPSRNIVVAHWTLEVPRKQSFIDALAIAGAHLIVVTCTFGIRHGQVAEFVKDVLDDEKCRKLQACLDCYYSDTAFVYRSDFIANIFPSPRERVLCPNSAAEFRVACCDVTEASTQNTAFRFFVACIGRSVHFVPRSRPPGERRSVDEWSDDFKRGVREVLRNKQVSFVAGIMNVRPQDIETTTGGFAHCNVFRTDDDGILRKVTDAPALTVRPDSAVAEHWWLEEHVLNNYVFYPSFIVSRGNFKDS